MSREKSIAMVVTILFFASCATAVYYFSGNKELNNQLGTAKLKSEKILSEKLNLEKDINSLKASIENYKSKNKGLDANLIAMKKDLAKKEANLKNLDAQQKSEISKYKKQVNELTASKMKLENEFNGLSADLKKQNADLQAKIAALEGNEAALENRQSALTKRNTMLSEIIGNNYSVEAHKRNDKLTINSKKTKQMLVGLEVPANMANELTIFVTNPGGKKLSNRNSTTISYNVTDEFKEGVLTASLSNNFILAKDSKRVAIKYQPTEKFKSGIYQIDVYYQDQYLGSSQIRLK